MGKTTGEVLKKFDAAQNGRSQAAPSKKYPDWVEAIKKDMLRKPFRGGAHQIRDSTVKLCYPLYDVMGKDIVGKSCSRWLYLQTLAFSYHLLIRLFFSRVQSQLGLGKPSEVKIKKLFYQFIQNFPLEAYVATTFVYAKLLQAQAQNKSFFSISPGQILAVYKAVDTILRYIASRNKVVVEQAKGTFPGFLRLAKEQRRAQNKVAGHGVKSELSPESPTEYSVIKRPGNRK